MSLVVSVLLWPLLLLNPFVSHFGGISLGRAFAAGCAGVMFAKLKEFMLFFSVGHITG